MGHTYKLRKAQALSGYSGYRVTCDAIFGQISQPLIDTCTARQIADIAKAINTAYHNGRASTGADMIDVNCVWIDTLKGCIEWQGDGENIKLSRSA